MENKELIRAAFAAREYAYAPYSHFCVGAALLCKDGRVYTGCNIESAAFTPGSCAERTALFKAVSEGARVFERIAIVGAKKGAPDDALVTSPCGVCRQMLFEFGGPSLRVIMAKSEDDCVEMTLGELLPLGFGPEKVL
ncbi:MAG: cytidine deaminase [Ruthenibacterium sp.]